MGRICRTGSNAKRDSSKGQHAHTRQDDICNSVLGTVNPRSFTLPNFLSRWSEVRTLPQILDQVRHDFILIPRLSASLRTSHQFTEISGAQETIFSRYPNVGNTLQVRPSINESNQTFPIYPRDTCQNLQCCLAALRFSALLLCQLCRRYQGIHCLHARTASTRRGC